jgi:hypothetical protein
VLSAKCCVNSGLLYFTVTGLSPFPPSDIVVQIVDARNPLLFRCEDLVSELCLGSLAAFLSSD